MSLEKKFKIDKNFITFVVIGKNEEKIIRKCLESILIFNQEIIYIDSDSSDNSLEVLKSYKDKVKVIDLKSTGYLHTGSLARKIGGELAKGKFIQFLDADMTINKNWIFFALDYLNKNKHLISAVVGFKKEYSSLIDKKYKLKNDNFFISNPDYLSGCFIINKIAYQKAGGFDPYIPWDEERELYLRFFQNGGRLKYLNHLMANHYDYKTSKRGLSFYLINEKHKCFWLMISKVAISMNFKSYIIIYRHMLVVLFFEIISMYFLYKLNFLNLFLSQLTALTYCISVKRRGAILYWKSILLTTAVFLFKRNKKKFNYRIL